MTVKYYFGFQTHPPPPNIISFPKRLEFWRLALIFENQRIPYPMSAHWGTALWNSWANFLYYRVQSSICGVRVRAGCQQAWQCSCASTEGYLSAKSKPAVGYIPCPSRITVGFSGQSTATIIYPGCLAKSPDCPSMLSCFHICVPV